MRVTPGNIIHNAGNAYRLKATWNKARAYFKAITLQVQSERKHSVFITQASIAV